MATLDERYQIDDLAAQAGGYFAPPTKEDMAYTELLFDVCQQFASVIIPQQKKSATSWKK